MKKKFGLICLSLLMMTLVGTSFAAPPASAQTSATTSIVAATNAFLATLDTTEKGVVQFDFSNTAQKQRWSNLPQGAFTRAGLMWGNMTTAQQNAWLAVMAATLSKEGYDRVIKEWNADDVLAAQQGSGGGGGQLIFGKNYYFIAIIGTPSTTTPWQWQWGGHHVTVNATIVGNNVALTPSFIGCQPCTYTDASGNTVRPLGDIEDEAFALVNSLDATQKAKAVLGSTSIDLVLGPGQDGKTVQAEGLVVTSMNATQQAALLKLIGHYTGLVNDTAAALRMADVKSHLAETYFVWYGPTTAGSTAYFRISGSTIVIEYSPQGGGGGGGGVGGTVSNQHIHGIYRDPTNDYGAALLQGTSATPVSSTPLVVTPAANTPVAADTPQAASPVPATSVAATVVVAPVDSTPTSQVAADETPTPEVITPGGMPSTGGSSDGWIQYSLIALAVLLIGGVVTFTTRSRARSTGGKG